MSYQRFSYLGERLNSGYASKAEKDEYMRLALQYGAISQQQYNNYENSNDQEAAEAILKAALVIGAIILLVRLFSSK